jgi:16S rRNA (cytosine967-C5)-methyltransferase
VISLGKTTEQSIGTDILTPLTSELLYGSLRHYYGLSRLIDACLERPLKEKDQVLYALLLVGAYQLLNLRVPDHAAINETVAAVSQLKKPWARGLINAVLRRIASNSKDSKGLVTDQARDERSFELPSWILERLRHDFPDQAMAVAEATLERAPMSLRVNLARVSADVYRQQLQAASVEAHQGNFPEHLILAEPVSVQNLPGYRSGLVSVQDAGAQFAAHLCPDSLPEAPRILDACAAPGGKLFHLAERFPEARLTGLELSTERLAQMAEEAERLGHRHVQLRSGDATARDWLQAPEPASFDLILLDAPCTGTGTLRRHPDIKVLRKPHDVAVAAKLQLALLENLWPLLSPGGTLIYCTCSLFAEENDQVIEAFLARANTAAAETDGSANALPTMNSPTLPIGTATRQGWQLLPLPAGAQTPNRTVDGFYFARMTRQEKAR